MRIIINSRVHYISYKLNEIRKLKNFLAARRSFSLSLLIKLIFK